MRVITRIVGTLVWACIVILPTASGAEVVDRIIAVVNDDIVLLSDLNEQIEKVTQSIRKLDYPLEKQRELLNQLRERALEELIDKKLAEQEIKRLNIQVSDAEVDNAVERFKDNNRLNDAQLRDALAQQGTTLEAYREEVRQQLLRGRLMSSEVRSKIVITPAEIEAYYNANQDEYASELSYRLKNILFSVDSTDADAKEEARQRMLALRDRIEAGMTFEDAARRFSEAPNAERGGILGKFSADTLSAPIREAVKSLDEGDLSPVVDTDQGFQLFLIEEIEQRDAIPLKEVAPQIEETLYNQVVDEQFQKWITSLRENAFIKIIQ